MGRLIFGLVGVLLSANVFASDLKKGYEIGERMPPIPEENYETTWFRTWETPRKDKKGVTIYHDLNKDGDYDLAISYIKCEEEGLRIKNPYGIFDRRGIYGEKGILYLDYDMNDYIDKITKDVGKRKIGEDIPKCPIT